MRAETSGLELLDRARLAAPAMGLHADQVEVFTHLGPEEFHQRLRHMLRHARERIALASLYFGTGALERELVDDIRHALERSAGLRVDIVVDYCRGRRKTANGNSPSFLAELLAAYPERVGVYLHRMPQFSGPLALLPSPLDECIAVCHVKILLADDQVIITGANLSDEYFHCRQARYLVVRDARFADMSQDIVATTAAHSVRVCADRARRVAYAPAERPAHELYRALGRTFARARARDATPGRGVWLVPMFQHPALRVQEERELLRSMFAWTDGDLTINTPYPNFPEDYVRALAARLHAGCTRQTLLVSPSGNCHGFSTGRGPKALVPGVYLARERAITRALEEAAQHAPVAPRFEHYERDGWVFHSKGVWFETERESATIIGSSSFGERSVTRDYDLSYYVVTREPAVREALGQEIATVLAHTGAARADERPLPWLVPLLVPLVKPFL